jgi:cytochrome c5
MRYKHVGTASYAIALLLLAVAVVTAVVRGRTPAAGRPGPAAAADAGTPDRPSLGREVFEAECSACHPGGEAVGRAIPALRGRFVVSFTAAGGREAAIDLLLRGTTPGDGGHPEYAHLSDAALAAVVNHMLAAWGNEALLPEGTPLLAPGEVAARR